MTVVDTGWPRSWPRVEAAVGQLGRSLRDVRAVLLTHGHPDHLGAAEKARRGTGARVYAHREEVPRTRGHARGASPFALVPGLLPHLWRPSAFGFVLHATAHEFMTPQWVQEVSPFDGDQPLDVPGGLRPVFAPGHTEGHTAYYLPERGVLFSGDALATLDVHPRAGSPSHAGRVEQRFPPDARIAGRPRADPGRDAAAGHGDPWTGRLTDAVEQARTAA